MTMDWGDGSYELTAKNLVPATHEALAVLEPLKGRRVLDLGCGTGNAALEAARRGAHVIGVDPAARLVEVARARAAEAKLDITFERGEGARVPLADAAVDDAVAVFSVIFAPDARAVSPEVRRVVKQGGRFAMTAWMNRGAVFDSGMILRKALMAAAPAPAGAPPTVIPQWHETAFVSELFGGAKVVTTEHTLHFTAASAEAWFEEQERAHPVWRMASGVLGPVGTWAAVRAQSISALQAGNVSKTAFDAVSGYVVHCVSL